MVLAQPLRGSDVGTWDVPVNVNMGILDQAFGGVTTLALSSASITLAASQAQNAIIRLTGNLTANVSITLPSIYKFWTIDNQLVNSPSSFAATLVSTSGASIIGLPPSIQDVFYDGINVNYRNLGNVGEYWDYAAGTIPTWVTLSTKPPYLNCNGTAFSSATYPILANLLGTTTLPDQRGMPRYSLNQGTSRLNSSNAGVDGNTIFATKTTVTVTIGTSNLPSYTPSGSLSLGSGTLTGTANFGGSPLISGAGSGVGGGGAFGVVSGTNVAISGNPSGSFIGNNNGGVSSPLATVATALVSGITMIRAA
jgi:hypothetical protein